MTVEHATPAIERANPAVDRADASGHRRQALEQIAAEVRTCTRCRLSLSRTNAVPGEGHPDAEVMFVGEGPGQNEDQQGRPFVGAAGGLLSELIRSIGWRREEVFITNIVKCRPPGNRDPEPDEIAACAPYLRRQLEALEPALVVTLGRHSMQAFTPGARIGQAHGTVRRSDASTGTNASAYAMYHPAAAFRQPGLRTVMQADMCGIPAALVAARAARSVTAIEPPYDPPSAPPPLPNQEPIDAPQPGPGPGIEDPDVIPIDEPLQEPEPEPAPLPAPVPAAVGQHADDQQLSFFA